ncbi:MAG: cell division protein FtsH, partial [Candidatus Hydrogenedentes bacterium]|nr:cell division protein FtsH [Candidatus Hydrogenedentota bacterium]
MGGRAAEEVEFNEFTTGAASDLKRATELAHAMVCQWGMSELGPISFGGSTEVFLGRDFVRERDFSEETASSVDKAIHKILEDGYADARRIVTENRAVLTAIADALVDRETLEADELDDIIRRVGGENLLPPRDQKPSCTEAPKKAADSEPAPPEEPDVNDVSPGEVVPGTA